MEIAARLAEVYGAEESEQTITAITGKLRGAQNALFGVTSIATATGGSSAQIGGSGARGADSTLTQRYGPGGRLR